MLVVMCGVFFFFFFIRLFDSIYCEGGAMIMESG